MQIELPSSFPESLKPGHIKLCGDSAVEGDLSTSWVAGPHFQSLMADVFGDYMEDKLYEIEVKKSYMEHSRKISSYKATQAYVQAQATHQLDIEKYKKDLRKFRG